MNKTRRLSEPRGTRIEIFHELLLTLEQQGGRMSATHLLSTANIAQEKAQEYINILEQEGLIGEEKDGGRKMYVSTRKSPKFLNKYERFNAFADAFGLVT